MKCMKTYVTNMRLHFDVFITLTKCSHSLNKTWHPQQFLIVKYIFAVRVSSKKKVAVMYRKNDY